jgi:hypothetical protein
LCRLLGKPGNPREVELVLRSFEDFSVDGHQSEFGRHMALMTALDWPELAEPKQEELTDIYSIYQADYSVLSSNMFSHVVEGWRETGNRHLALSTLSPRRRYNTRDDALSQA